MSSEIDKLEKTVLELGAEVYRLRHRIGDFSDKQESMLKVLTSLRKLLDAKGVISNDDFDQAVDSLPEMIVNYESEISEELFNELKKASH